MTAPPIFWHFTSPNQPVLSVTLPPKLYYVRHHRSQALEAEDGGFKSRAPAYDIRHPKLLKKNAELHFNWKIRGWDSCFVSAFGHIEHAQKWAWNVADGHHEMVEVHQLDTSKLPPGALVLNAFLMCAALGINHPFNKQKDEYLFCGRIPGACVEASWNPFCTVLGPVTVAPMSKLPNLPFYFHCTRLRTYKFLFLLTTRLQQKHRVPCLLVPILRSRRVGEDIQ